DDALGGVVEERRAHSGFRDLGLAFVQVRAAEERLVFLDRVPFVVEDLAPRTDPARWNDDVDHVARAIADEVARADVAGRQRDRRLALVRFTGLRSNLLLDLAPEAVRERKADLDVRSAVARRLEMRFARQRRGERR